MKTRISTLTLSIAAFGASTALSLNPAVADTASDLAALKARMKQLEATSKKLEAQIAKEKREAQQARNASNGAKGEAGKEAPPPVFVDLRKGLFVETEDKQYAFKIGGRVVVDGGGTAGNMGNAWQGNAWLGQARLEVEGKAKVWFYKLQYDFANRTENLWQTNISNSGIGGSGLSGAPPSQWTNYAVTDRNYLWGGFRDMFLGYQDERLSHPLLAQPVFFKVGNQWEPFSLEAIHSTKYRDTIERPLAVQAIAPARHIGVDMGFIGKDNWTANFGFFTLSPEDNNMRPVNTSSGTAGQYVLQYGGNGIATKSNWYSPYGGAPYWDATGRITYAPIFDEHRLAHFGVSGSFHQQNSSTAYSDDRNSAPGNRLGSEANVLGSAYLGTTDLSCGRFNQPVGLSGWNTYNVAGNCIKNIEKVDLEAAFAYYNLYVQGEWLQATMNRNPYQAQQFALAQAGGSNGANAFQNGAFISPANSKYVYGGGYVTAQYWITGEEYAQSYDQTDKAGANFSQLKIKDRFSNGGWGAWGIEGRWSVVNLNNGPYQGQNLFNNLLLANAANVLSGASGAKALSSAYLFGLQNQIANSGIYGGYQQNVTAGINWYPDPGVAFQFNATHVMSLKSPLNWSQQAVYESGNHPTFLEMRTKIYF